VRSLVIELRNVFNGALFRNQSDDLKQLDERSETFGSPCE